MKQHAQAHRGQNAARDLSGPVSDRRWYSCSAHPKNQACCGMVGDSQTPARKGTLARGHQWGDTSEGTISFPSAGHILTMAFLRPWPAGQPPTWHQTPPPWGGAEVGSDSHDHQQRGPAPWQWSELQTTHSPWFQLGELGKADRGGKDRWPGGNHPSQCSPSTKPAQRSHLAH